MREIFIVSNDRFYLKKGNYYNSNKNTFTIVDCFKKLKKVHLISRISKKKLKFKSKLNNTQIVDIFKIFKIQNKIRKTKTLIISLTPFNFLVGFILIFLGVKKDNLYLFLRSDGYEEYRIKFGILGYYFYSFMLIFLKKNLTILSCSKSLTGISKPRMVYPSEINDKWLKNRKKQIKTISQNKTINLFYLGRFREEKGYQSLLDLFEQLSIKADLKMIGNDFKYLKKKDYPKNKNLKILGQISSPNELIKHYNNADIFILPSYVEAYPQVILESLSRLKPIVIFNEIKYLKKTFPFGLFNCDRNIDDFEKNLKKIIKDYKKIQKNILKKQVYSKKNYEITMNKIFEIK